MITDIKEKLANMQAKYIDKQSAKLVLRSNVAINFWPRKMSLPLIKKLVSKKNYSQIVAIRKGRRSYAFIISFACSSF